MPSNAELDQLQAELMRGGPLTFNNGAGGGALGDKLKALGFDPATSKGGWQPFLDSLRNQIPGTPPPASPTASPQTPATPVTTAPLQEAANTNAVAPLPPPPAMQMGQIQAALGIPPTRELANKFRYNPPWRPF